MTAIQSQLELWRSQIEYEKAMFDRARSECHAREIDPALKQQDLGLNHAWVDCFCVHLRNLVTFFFVRPTESRGDLSAKHLLSPQGWRTWERKYLESSWAERGAFAQLEPWRDAAHWYLAHTSRKRGDGTPNGVTFTPDGRRPDWDVEQLGGLIDQAWAELNEMAPVGGPLVARLPTP